MKWITAAELGRWGESIAARTELPGLVGDLIRATAPGITTFRFPSGDKGQVRGFDGHLEAAEAATFVPKGRSYWEFGASKSQASKFGDDIEKRTKQVAPNERAETTFVFVTPQTWDNPKKELDEAVRPYRENSGWKDVQYIDGSKLETWLDEAPAVAATHARTTLRTKPQIGARSTEEFWDAFSARFRVDLTEAVLLCEREKQQGRVLEHLQGTGGVLTLTADSPDEVIAFAVASIRKAPPELRLFLEARTLVVDTEEAALHLRASTTLAFLVRDKARSSDGMLSRVGPTIVGLGYDQRGNDDFLERPSTQGMAKALATMDGIDEHEGAILARTAGRSVTILARTIPRGAAERPAWVAEGRSIVPAMLAGTWNSLSEEDRRMIQMLTPDADYGRLEEVLRPLTRIEDAPIDLIGSLWRMRAPVDAFVHLGHLVTEADLKRLAEVGRQMFGTIIDESPDEQPFLNRGPPKGPTRSLRDGIAQTLLYIAVLPDQAKLNVAGVHPQEFVNDLVKNLPGLSTDVRLIMSIRDQLPVLMEAAPDPLLEALEQLLEGNVEAVTPLLTEREGFLTPSSPLTDVLWALERLAWDNGYLERVGLLLARMAELDPGGRLSNRPINSLQTIFTPWLPSTHARLPQRLAVLGIIATKHDEIGWKLFVELLPESRSFTSLTSKPRFREAGASEQEILTRGMVHQTYIFLINQVIDLASNDPSRWTTLVKRFPNFPPDLREKFYDRLTHTFAHLGDDGQQLLWEALRDQVGRHRSFSDAVWALPAPELERLEKVLSKYEPTSNFRRERWLFDEWFPDMPGDFEGREKQIEKARQLAVRQMMEQGYETVLDAAREVKLPHLLGTSAGKVLPVDVIESLAIDMLGAPDEAKSFVVALSAVAHERFGAEWEERLRTLRSKLNDADTALLLLAWPDHPSTWNFAASLGGEVEQQYWLRKQPFRLHGEDAETVDIAIGKYLDIGRPSAALTVVSERFEKTPPEILFRILDALPEELNSGQPVDQLTGYMVESALEALSKRDDVELTEIARREFLYLELLRFRKEPLTIHRVMATDPTFYFSVIASVFRARSDESSKEPSTEESARARAGYTLLSEFRTVPGSHDGTVNFDELRAWIDAVRRLAAESDRVAITDDFIGRILAHSRTDDQDELWPHRAVRQVIEELRSEPLEEGFAVEKYNSRGVVTKAIFEGGKQERDISDHFRSLARKITSPRTSELLHRMAKHYAHYADAEDLRARQDKLERS